MAEDCKFSYGNASDAGVFEIAKRYEVKMFRTSEGHGVYGMWWETNMKPTWQLRLFVWLTGGIITKRY